MEQKSTQIQQLGNITALPESCIATILSFTTPRDACCLSLVSPLFNGASLSDTVWKNFLPHDYSSVLSQSSDPSLLYSSTSKKHLFLSLCQKPVIIDSGKKSFALDKWSGKKCYMLSARDLSIIWSDETRYWRWNSDPDSRFEEVVELVDVCWLEVRGKISTSMLSPSTLYSAYLVFKHSDTARGLDRRPAEATVGVGGESESDKRNIDLDGSRRRVPGRPGDGISLDESWMDVPGGRIGGGMLPIHISHMMQSQASISQGGENEEQQAEEQGPKRREDGWLEVELGNYFNDGNDDEELEASVLEVKGGHWKSGLIIQGIELRPKHNK